MVVLFIFVAVGAALLASSRKPTAKQLSAPTQPQQQLQPQQGGGDALQLPQGTESTLATLATAAAPGVPAAASVAAAVAYTAAGAALGGELTGDTAGAVAGGVNPILGNAGNLGRLAGKELDKFFGGDGTGLSGTVAQVSGFIIVGVGAIFASTIVGIIFVIPFMFGLATLALPIWLLSAAISDWQRLAYGQTGAKADLERDWQMFKDGLASDLRTNAPSLTDMQIERAVVPIADGYAKKLNRLRYGVWMKRAHGVGMNDAAHARYGRDRGYFYGDADGITGELVELFHGKAFSAEYLQNVPVAELVFTDVPVFHFYEVLVAGTPDPTLAQLYKFQPELLFKREDAPNAHSSLLHPIAFIDPSKAISEGYIGTKWERRQNGTEKRASDPATPKLEEVGAVLANVAGYVRWMNDEPRGAFKSESEHAVWGRSEGRFEGSIVSGEFEWFREDGALVAKGNGGVLEYQGTQYFWRGPDGKVGVIRKTLPPPPQVIEDPAASSSSSTVTTSEALSAPQVFSVRQLG